MIKYKYRHTIDFLILNAKIYGYDNNGKKKEIEIILINNIQKLTGIYECVFDEKQNEKFIFKIVFYYNKSYFIIINYF